MKKSIFILIFLLLTLIPAKAVKKIEANPINVAVVLTEYLDSIEIDSTCVYYGYSGQPSQDGYKVFQHPNGSVIRYKFTIAENGESYPTIEVKSKASQKERDQILEQLNFEKIGSSYERSAKGHMTMVRCSSVSHGYLRFTNHPKIKSNGKSNFEFIQQ